MEWMLLPLRRYVDFQGRSRRMEFWMFALLNVVVMTVIGAVLLAGFPWQELIEAGETGIAPQLDMMNWGLLGTGGILYLLWWLGTIIPTTAVAIRRLHDRDMSGWWYGAVYIGSFLPLVNILAMVGWLVLLVLFLLPGTDGPNRFGPDPKDPSQASVFA